MAITTQSHRPITDGQNYLLCIDLDSDLEAMAQRYAAQIIASRSTIADKDTQYEAVDIASVSLVRPRHIGIEHLALTCCQAINLG
jgi:hypothetical protein